MGIRRRKRGHRSWPQRLLILVNSVLVIACVAAAGVFNLIRTKASELPVVDIGAEVRQRPDQSGPRNFLLVGTDDADGLDKNDPIKKGRGSGEHLADVIMILRVDPATKAASLLSIPRDTWIPISPTWSKSKINSAFGGNDGPNTLIATIKHNFGISIDNYVQVDFGGFRDLVEVLGGLTTFNTHPIRDPSTGLFLPETGCIYVEPTQALAYARSRHLEYQEGDTYNKNARWKTDPTGDLGRITRQQDFLRQAAQTAIDEGIRNPSTALGLVNAAIGSVQTDNDLDAGQIVELIQTFRDFSVQNLEAEQIPTVGSGRAGVISYQEVVWEEAEGLLDIYRGIRGEGEVVPSDVIVGLPPTVPASAELAQQLEAAGFDAGTEDASVVVGGRKAAVKPTVIRFGLRGIEAAQVLAGHLSGEVTYEFSTGLPGRRLELIPGTEVPTLLETPTPIDQVPVPSIAEQRTGKGGATTTTTSPSTTTTTRRSTTTVAPSSTTTSVVSPSTTSTLDADVTTTTAIGVNTFDADAATQCPG